jgi:hypothetical protein
MDFGLQSKEKQQTDDIDVILPGFGKLELF